MATNAQDVNDFVTRPYDAGFYTDIEQDTAPPGLNEDIIRLISSKYEEPEWRLVWRLKAFARWRGMR